MPRAKGNTASKGAKTNPTTNSDVIYKQPVQIARGDEGYDKFSESAIEAEMEMPPEALNTLVRTRSLFRLPIEQLYGMTFNAVARLRNFDDEVNEQDMNDTDPKTAQLRGNINIVFQSSGNAPRVSLSVRQILNLNVNIDGYKCLVSDLMYMNRLTAVPQQFTIVSVVHKKKEDGSEGLIYPLSMYKAFNARKAVLKKEAKDKGLDYDYRAIYQEDFIDTLRDGDESTRIPTCTESDAIKDIVVSVPTV